ncbi:MAG: aminotransferase class V-fold PLP-dependent enzyme [Erysipelotrichia bacterium]|nr:aminotransferase class V-fold PLP-dependent enzyme [Erysipelotrichia bacterium]
MLSFTCDYLEGAHPEILKKLSQTNLEQTVGYGEDDYCLSAKEKIKKAIDNPNADIYFLCGGTQTNQIAIAGLLKPYEGVICADSGHINVHEAGAIEYCGHKVLAIPQHDGKINSTDLQEYLSQFYADDNQQHMVYPGMVYISYPTEYGTLYSRRELEDIYALCKKYDLTFYIDGARLGYGVVRGENSLKDIAHLCDVFYIGGTKIGALFGEALIFCNNNTPKHFTTVIKQHGALLAKGRMLGIQFDCLFQDDLYIEICQRADEMADEIRRAFKSKNYRLVYENCTNQVFVLMSKTQIERLKTKVDFAVWDKYDEDTYITRFVSSWATTLQNVEILRSLI